MYAVFRPRFPVYFHRYRYSLCCFRNYRSELNAMARVVIVHQATAFASNSTCASEVFLGSITTHQTWRHLFHNLKRAWGSCEATTEWEFGGCLLRHLRYCPKLVHFPLSPRKYFHLPTSSCRDNQCILPVRGGRPKINLKPLVGAYCTSSIWRPSFHSGFGVHGFLSYQNARTLIHGCRTQPTSIVSLSCFGLQSLRSTQVYQLGLFIWYAVSSRVVGHSQGQVARQS